jgi:PAS domain S-box-containing protein
LDQEVRERTAELATTNQRLLQELAERQRAEALLRESEEKYRGLIQRIQAAVVVHGADTRILTSNPRAQQLLGLTEEQMMGKSAIDPDWHFFREDGTTIPQEEYPVNRVLTTGHPLRDAVVGVHRPTTKDDVWVLVSADPVVDEQGEMTQVIVTFVDITTRRKAQADLHRLNRQLRAISTCNQVLMQASDEQALLNDICRIVCQVAGYRMAWVGYPQNDDARTVRPVAWAGVEEGYLAEVGITWADTERGRGPAGRAIREGVSACIQDFATDPHVARWRESAMQRGYRSSTALPLKEKNAAPFGVLCVYSTEPNTFTPAEIRLLEELSSNLAFGIRTLRMRVGHKKAERQLLASEQLFRALVENSPDFIARYDRELRRIYVNPAIQKLFGGQTESVIGKTPADQSPLYAPQVYMDNLRQAIETGAESTAEIPFRTARGEMHWGHIRFVPELGQDGNVLSVLSIGRDIHDIKENEQRFRMLAENFPDFVFRFDRDGRFTYVNPAVEKAFGMPAEAIVGKTFQELPQRSKPEQNDAHLALIHRAFDEGEANESEAHWDTDLGERIFEIRHAPEKDAAGNVVSVVGIARDITERKRNYEINSARLHLLQFATTHSLDELLEETLNEAEKLTDSLIGFYHFVEDDQKSLTLQNWSTRTKTEFCKAEGKGLHYPIAQAGVWVDCVHQRKAVIHNDYPSLPHRKGMPEGHAEVIRELVVPVLRGEEIKAILGVGNKPVDYTENDVEAISLLADLAWEIAELKQAESALRESKEKYNAIVAGFDGLIYICSQDYRVEFMNDKFIERTGYYPKGEFCYKALHELDSICPWCVNERVFKGETVRWEVKSPKDDRWYYVVNTPIYNADGSVSKQAMILDITERKEAEAKLINYRDHLEELVQERTVELEIAKSKAQQYLDIAGVILVAIDADRLVTLINQKGCEILGSSAGEIIGKDWFETYVPADIRQDVIQGFNRLIAGEIEPVEYFENPILTQDGQERLIAWHNALLRDDGGNIVGTLSSGEDITEQKRVEEKITNLNQDLLIRTAALEEVNRELEAFAYSVSHDLRAPLRHIDGFMELLQKRTATVLDERSRHYMDTISGSAKRMGTLIDDLLSFSRMGRNQMSYQQVDLVELTQEVIREFETETKNRDIHWCVDDLPVVTGDFSMLRIVMVNLISNALKFTRPRMQAEIEIGWLREQETETVIFVRDNGVGFDMNYADKLFNVFQRLHRVDEFEGTGIGLANVRRIISRHGGKTWVTGELNHGATFYFSLTKTL